MLIDCPACARSYHVGRAEIGAGGRTVVCPRCEASWFVDGDGTSMAIPTPADLHVPAYSERAEPMAMDLPRSKTVSRRTIGPMLASLACVVLAMGGLGARERIVKLVPQTAGLYAAIGLPVNVRGLAIEALAPVRPDASPTDLTVSGRIHNVAERRVAVPRLTYQVRDGGGAPLLTWTESAPAHTLAKGRSLPFVSSPHRLPPNAQSILVRFEDADPSPPVRLARSIDR